MASNVDKILECYPDDAVILAFIQKFHWRNVLFIRSRPSKRALFKYYFANFKGLSIKNIDERVYGVGNPVLTKYWEKVGGLAHCYV
jgi:hypothetical protein